MSNSVVGEFPAPLPASGAGTGRGKSAWRLRGKGGIVVLAAASIAALASVFVYERSKPAVSPFRTARVVRADITQHVTATGSLQPVITSPVGAQVSGIVWKLHADFNSVVRAGQVLVELDPSLFQNAVVLASAQLAQAEAALSSARATAQGASSARDRTLGLQQESVATGAELDAAAATLGQTAGLVRSSVAQVAQARAQLARAQLDLQHSVIRSPVDGTVISRTVDVGQAVASTLTAPTLFTIAQDLRHMQVHAAVDEADIGQVRADQSATFTVDAFRGETFAARVHEVRNAPQTAQNVVTYDVVLDVDNPEGKLRPGMTANVLILIVQRAQVAALPNEALRFRPRAASIKMPRAQAGTASDRQGAAVYVPDGADAERVSIETGVTDGNLTEVNGLEVGREVIIDVVNDKGKAPAAGVGRRDG